MHDVQYYDELRQLEDGDVHGFCTSRCHRFRLHMLHLLLHMSCNHQQGIFYIQSFQLKHSSLSMMSNDLLLLQIWHNLMSIFVCIHHQSTRNHQHIIWFCNLICMFYMAIFIRCTLHHPSKINQCILYSMPNCHLSWIDGQWPHVIIYIFGRFKKAMKIRCACISHRARFVSSTELWFE